MRISLSQVIVFCLIFCLIFYPSLTKQILEKIKSWFSR